MAMAFTATVFKNGKVLAQIRSVTGKPTPSGPSMVLAADDPCWYDPTCDVSGGGGGGSGGGGSGGGGWGGGTGGGGCCQSELTDYLLAAAAFATATQAAIDTGTALVPWWQRDWR